MAEIAPCPFCGNADQDEFAVHKGNRGGPYSRDLYNAACSCGALGPDADTREEAVERWNRARQYREFVDDTLEAVERAAIGPTCRWCGQHLVLEPAERQGGPLNDSVAVCSNCKREQS